MISSDDTKLIDAEAEVVDAAVHGAEATEQEAVGVSAVLKIRDFRFALISGAILVFGFEMRAIAQSWLAL